MWFWNIIKGVLHNIFVEVWVVGLIAFTIFVFIGLSTFISLFSSLKEQGGKFIDFYFFVCLIIGIIAIGAAIYILYWYFTNHHYILGPVAVLISLAVIYITCIEPYIHN